MQIIALNLPCYYEALGGFTKALKVSKGACVTILLLCFAPSDGAYDFITLEWTLKEIKVQQNAIFVKVIYFPRKSFSIFLSAVENSSLFSHFMRGWQKPHCVAVARIFNAEYNNA